MNENPYQKICVTLALVYSLFLPLQGFAADKSVIGAWRLLSWVAEDALEAC